MMLFIHLFAVLLFIVYCWLILKSFLKVLEISFALKKLANYLLSAMPVTSSTGVVTLIKEPDYQDCLLKVLHCYPIIKKYSKLRYVSLRYGGNDLDNHKAAQMFFNHLKMKRVFLAHNLLSSLNPFLALRTLLAAPSFILRFFGFYLKPTTSRLINLLSWVATTLLGMYSDEVKHFLNSLIQ